MSAFTKKLNQIKQTFASDYGLKKPVTMANVNSIQVKRSQPITNLNRVKSLSRCEIKVSSPECKNENYLIRQPVIIETKNPKKKSYSISDDISRKYSSVRKPVEPFVPLVIPTRDRSDLKRSMQSLQTAQSTTRNNRQIEIFIEKDKSDNKQCLQKLFKKIHLLEQQLGTSQKQRHRLEVQVEHLRKKNRQCNDHQKVINKLQGDKYKLEMEVEMLKKQLKGENRKFPKQTVKQIIVQKPVQVRVEVPKYIQGPQRIVQKIVEVQKKIPFQVKITSPPQIVEKPIYIEVQKPIYLDKPIYVDKPVYVNNPVQKIVQKIVEKKVEVPVQVPFSVPFQVPVYIDRPVIDQQWMIRLQGIEDQLGMVMRENHELKADNHHLRIDNESLRSTVDQLSNNLMILQQHNEEKNRQVQFLLRNGQDYLPVCNENLATRDNSFSSKQTNYMSNNMNNLPSPRSKRYF